jgi:sucrose-6-phosphate hydrolase SacC (GH32 family)
VQAPLTHERAYASTSRPTFGRGTRSDALYDEGSNFYAASAARHSQYGPIVWGWATEGRTKDWSIDADWSGMITLPRIVAPSPDGRLSSRPIPTLENLRGTLHTVEREDGSASVADLPAQLELQAVLDTRDRPNSTTTLTLQFSPSERLELVIDWDAGTVCIDRDQASKDQRAHRGSFTFEDSDITAADCLTLRWFIDGSISELFTSSGRCSTVRFYPTSPPPWTLNATGLTSTDRLSVWPMATRPSTGNERRIRVREGIAGRHDGQYDQPLHGVGIVQCQPVPDAAAPVVPGDGEALEPE